MPDVVERGASSAPAVGGGSVMLTIGPVSLGVSTSVYQRARRSTAWRWPAHDLIGRRPARQWTGPGAEQITLDGVVMPSFRGSNVVRVLLALARSGEPQVVTAGTGEVWGTWCLESVEESRTAPFGDGAPRRIAWTLKLVHSGEDGPAGLQDGLRGRSAAVGDVRGVTDAVTAVVARGGSAADVAAAAAAAAGTGAGSGRVAAAATAAASAGLGPADVARAALSAAARFLPASPALAAVTDVLYRASEGETLDEIAWRRFGSTVAVAAVLALNPTLARLPRLPAGTLVHLPAVASLPPPVTEAVALWD